MRSNFEKFAIDACESTVQYDKGLFMDLPIQYMKTTSAEHGENMLCTQIVFCFCFDIQNNLCTKHVLPMF